MENTRADKSIKRLDNLFDQLAKEIKENPKGGPVFSMFRKYLNTLDSCVAIVTKDKELIFINQRIRERLIELGVDPDSMIYSPCLGVQKGCGLINNCPLEQAIETNKIITRCNVDSPISDKKYHVTCMPLKHNGTSAVIEMWIEVD